MGSNSNLIESKILEKFQVFSSCRISSRFMHWTLHSSLPAHIIYLSLTHTHTIYLSLTHTHTHTHVFFSFCIHHTTTTLFLHTHSHSNTHTHTQARTQFEIQYLISVALPVESTRLILSVTAGPEHLNVMSLSGLFLSGDRIHKQSYENLTKNL